MYPLKKAMVCLDLSEIDDVLIQYVAFLHKTVGFENLTFVHVIQKYDLPEEMSEAIPELNQPLEELICDEINDRLSEFFADDVISDHLDVVVKEGSETNEIIEVAREKDVDLLVLGKKTGYRGKGVLPGKIVRFVHCSVLFVPEMARHQVKRILTPIDFDDTSKRAVEGAYQMAQQFEAKLFCQHVYHYPKQYFPYIATEKFAKGMTDHLEKKFSRFKEKLEKVDTDLDCQYTLAEGKEIARKVYDMVVQKQIDMIVAGSAGRTKAASYFSGSVADRFAQYSFGVPLLIVKDKKKNKTMLDALLGRE
ncbi:MAG: universal stress protein [Bacteroidota bacterium]